MGGVGMPARLAALRRLYHSTAMGSTDSSTMVIAEVAEIGERAFRIRLEDATQIADSLVEVAVVFKRRQRRIIGHRCFLRSHALIIPFETCVNLPKSSKAGQDFNPSNVVRSRRQC